MVDKCECVEPGFCSKLNMRMNRPRWLRCQRDHAYAKFVLGQGPRPYPQPVEDHAPARPQVKPEAPANKVKRTKAWFKHLKVPESKRLDCAILFGSPPKG